MKIRFELSVREVKLLKQLIRGYHDRHEGDLQWTTPEMGLLKAKLEVQVEEEEHAPINRNEGP